MKGVSLRHPAVLVALCATISGCSEKIVYRDLPDFVDPPSGALGFLGYSSTTSQATTCGNCHSGKQAKWSATKHSHAWSDLVASGAQAKECESCHSVSYRGNLSTDTTAGYPATQSTRYQDVQCESCHGAGLTHVTNPDIGSNKPLASLKVGTTLTNGCGECHTGHNQPFVEEWAGSGHGTAPGTRGTRDPCWSCHEATHVLKAWGVVTNYLEYGKDTTTTAVVCAVCHDPHNAQNAKQLRFPINVPDLEVNLCMKCHYRRSNPEVTSSSGPHSPQGPTLLGEAGWFPPNFTYPPGSLVGSHGSDRNPKLCATCHVVGYQLKDAGGKVTFESAGHSFQAIPCVDAQGIPLDTETCDDSQRSFKVCVQCHLTEGAARTVRAVAASRILTLADQVDTLLTKVPATEFSTTDNKITTAEGSRFNSRLGRMAGARIHNPFLVEALLIASVKQIQTDYGVKAVAGVSLRPELVRPPAVKVK